METTPDVLFHVLLLVLMEESFAESQLLQVLSMAFQPALLVSAARVAVEP